MLDLDILFYNQKNSSKDQTHEHLIQMNCRRNFKKISS
jgi:7,8-dihydro-6-hydroxymethylpterin-pyrophosphokinase